MTTYPTPTTGESPSPQKAPTLDALTTALKGKTITQGWDVVHAMSAGKVNDLLQRQFVVDVAKSSNLPPVEGKVPIAGNLSVELVDLVLGSPLIAFDPQHASGTASISIPVVSGMAHLLATTGPETTVLATQWISSTAGYFITGLVPLGTVEGRVEDDHDVVLEIENGSGFEADLGLPGATGTLLGGYLLSFIRQHATGYRYSLGTIVYDPKGAGFVPTGKFKIATQVDATDPTDKGRVLLFIPTTYNPDGGAQTVLELPNVVPAGMDTTLLIASATTFGKLISAAVGPIFGGAVSAGKLGTGASTLISTGGSADAGKAGDEEWGAGKCITGDTFHPSRAENVVVSLAGFTFSPSPDGKSISASWNSSWVQDFYSVTFEGGSWVPSCAPGQFTMGTNFSATYTPSVDKKDGSTVRFISSGKVTVTPPDKEKWYELMGDYGSRDRVTGQVQVAVNNKLGNIFNFTLPEVQAFAVSSLLFPSGKSSFSEARVPGDLMLCGTLVDADLSVNPALQVIEAGGTAKCEANMGPVAWSATLGKIDDDGNYTAPTSIARDKIVTITATLRADAKQKAYAAIHVVPAKVLVSPLIAVTQPQYAPQQFEASLPGLTDKPNWSLSPELGQIDDDGNYTPPDTMSEPTVVSVTATLGAAAGAATVLITPRAPWGVAVEPYATVPLGPGTEQLFVAKAGNQPIKPTWSLWPPGRGSIDEDTGLYRAPQTIDAPEGVVLMATDPSDPALTGTAVILLSPAD